MRDRVLITIPMSHYCEKARWGLERLGLEYREERHLQVFHYPRTWLASGGPNVPVLLDGAETIPDSTLILQYLDRYASPALQLYPQEPEARREVEQLEDRFDEQLGVDSRRWVYFHMLPHPLQAFLHAGAGVPWWQKLIAPLAYPFIAGWIAVLLKVNRRQVDEGVSRSLALVEEMDRRLADGRRYLTGDRFTAADLSFACMLAPFVLPPNYGIKLPEPGEVPAEMRRMVERFRSTASGRWVLELFTARADAGLPLSEVACDPRG